MPHDTGEHNTTIEYVREVGGRAYFEVPVSGPTVSPGSRVRRIDAVRFDGIGGGESLPYDPDRFLVDLHEAQRQGIEIELIEAKNRASRYTIGQAIAAGDLFLETFSGGGNIVLAVLYDETRADTALDRVCERRGIRVLRRPWVPGSAPDADEEASTTD